MEDGYERHYLKLVSFRDGVKFGNGFVCFNVDHTAIGNRRVMIHHMSTIKPRQLDNAIATVIDFIWRSVECDSI
jgi:hypothetical protein